jgi:nucleoside 2-deoxyribosyltransferase
MILFIKNIKIRRVKLLIINKIMKIYFAGSIRGGRGDREKYLKIIRHLQQYGKVLTEHVASGDLTEKGERELSDRDIHARDMEWLMSADVIVAEVTNPSLGVGYEIGRAVSENKKILCMYELGGHKFLSAMINGHEKIEVIKYDILNQALKKVDYFFKQELGTI